MDSKELIKVICDNDLQRYLFHLEDDYLEEFDCDLTDEEIKEMGLSVDDMESVDSREDTSEFWNIVYFKKFNIFLKVTGTYDSYGQYDHVYDDKVTEVFPKEITKTIYE